MEPARRTARGGRLRVPSFAPVVNPRLPDHRRCEPKLRGESDPGAETPLGGVRGVLASAAPERCVSGGAASDAPRGLPRRQPARLQPRPGGVGRALLNRWVMSLRSRPTRPRRSAASSTSTAGTSFVVPGGGSWRRPRRAGARLGCRRVLPPGLRATRRSRSLRSAPRRGPLRGRPIRQSMGPRRVCSQRLVSRSPRAASRVVAEPWGRYRERDPLLPHPGVLSQRMFAHCAGSLARPLVPGPSPVRGPKSLSVR
jgi:hypothetical protein